MGMTCSNCIPWPAMACYGQASFIVCSSVEEVLRCKSIIQPSLRSSLQAYICKSHDVGQKGSWEPLSPEEALACLELTVEMPPLENYVCILQKCKKLRSLTYAKRALTQIVDHGLEALGNYLVPMFVACESVPLAQQFFHKLAHRNEYAWTSLIQGYIECGDFQHAFKLFQEMEDDHVHPSRYTFLVLLKGCIKMKCLKRGRKVHFEIVNTGFESDSFVGNALVDMYAKCGLLVEAQEVFDELGDRDVVSWNALIAGYVELGNADRVLHCLEEMQLDGVLPDEVSFTSCFKACGSIGAIDRGQELHIEIAKEGFEGDLLLGNALIDMYAKCGLLQEAQDVLNELTVRDAVSWTALIAGYARRGESALVVNSFDEMRVEGIRPDAITLNSVLTACSHAGLVNKGWEHFEAMSKDYAITPTLEHYNCMVDLCGRAGQLNKVVAMLEKMPYRPNLVTWKSVLSSCKKWGDVELGRFAYNCAVKMDEEHAETLILMSNIYADAYCWEEAKKVEAMRVKLGACKESEKSWTEIGGWVHMFVPGNLQLEQLFVGREQIRYLSDTYHRLRETLDNASCGCSEKLAVASALVNTLEGSSIRVAKNLPVCDQCHTAMIFLSGGEQRTIICRDLSRLHIFKDAKCSCHDNECGS